METPSHNFTAVIFPESVWNVTPSADIIPLYENRYNGRMRKFGPFFLLATLLLALAAVPLRVQARPIPAPDLSTAYELIDAVNALRASYGLAPYTPNSILMGIAQTQAGYLASIGVANTHLDTYGRRPFQRALDAGYPVAGQLSQGGFFAENIVAGTGLTASEAVNIWMGDAPHQNTMLSTNLQDAGAGMAVSGGMIFYVLDAGLSTGGTPVPYTPPPYLILPTATIATSTPNPDGSIVHIVRPGDTLGSISMAYDIPLSEILSLNGLTLNSVIYPNQEIVLRAAYTATPTQPTPTSTRRPTSTLWPTSTPTLAVTSATPTPTKAAMLPSASSGGAVIAIIVVALLAAGVITLIGARKQKNP
jgi:uncharacterized protein YkwD/LysM repeat protein